MKTGVWLILLAMILTAPGRPVWASELAEEWLENSDLGEMEEYLAGQEETETIDFLSIVRTLLEGKASEAFSSLGKNFRNAVFGEITDSAGSLRNMWLLILFAALYLNLASGFTQAKSVGRIGFLTAYLMMAALVLGAYHTAADIAENVLTVILTFTKLLLPVFFVAVAYGGKTMTAYSFYQLTLILITGLEWALLHFFLPLAQTAAVLLLAGSLTEKDVSSRLAGFLETLFQWGIRAATGIVIGMNVIQGMTVPLADSVKNQSLRKIISALPWIGNGAGVLTEVVLGSGALLRNAIGAAGILVLLILAAVPFAKLAVIRLMVQALAAFAQPVADRRLLACLGSLETGCRLLLKLVFTVLVLLLITLAIICASAGLG